MAGANQIAITGTSVATAPAWAFSATVKRLASDTLGTSDTAAAARIQSRAAADALGTSDVATRVVVEPRTGADTLATFDVATRAPLTRARTAVDSLAPSTYDPTIDVDSPVSHWKLGNATTAVDRKGLRDLPVTSGSVASSAGLVANNGPDLANAFDSTNSFRRTVTLNDGLPYDTANWSIEAWVQPSVIATKRIATRSSDYELRLNAGGINSYTFSVLNTSLVTTSVSTGFDVAAVGRTTHIVVTYDGTDLIIYTDGVERERKPATGLRSQPDYVPAIPGGVGLGITGVIDEVAWYSGALSAARVLAHYQAGSVPAPSDTAAVARVLPRTAADALGTTDAATRAPVVRARTAADSLATSDVATRGPLSRVRTASDGLHNTYDPVVDADSPTSHWKLGDTASAVDRKGVADLPAVSGGLAVVAGITANAGPSLANQAVGTVNARFLNSGTGGTPYEGPYTMEAWVKPTADFNGAIFVRGGATYLGLTQDGRGTFVGADFSFENSAGTQTRRVSTINVGSVYHLVITHDGSTVVMYVNGAEVNRVTGVSGNRSIPTSIPNIVGASAGVWPRAVVDEVAWYSGALSAASVLAHYQAGTTTNPPIDVATRVVTRARTASDSLGTTDSAAGINLGGGLQSRTGTDSLATTDAAVRAPLVVARIAADALGTTDVATRAAFLFRVVSSDVLGTTDAAVRAPYVRGRSAADSLGTTDVATRITAQPRSATDVLATSDIATRALVGARTAVDTLATTDTATRAPLLRARSAADTLATTDTATRPALVGIRTASDALATTDAAIQVRLLPRAGTDSLGTTDVAIRAPLARTRSASDSLGTTDAAVQGIRTRSGSDTLATTDAAVRAPLVRGRAAADSLATTDQATRIVARPRTATDALGTTDVATRGVAVRSRIAADLGH
jgi:hypothetical protein